MTSYVCSCLNLKPMQVRLPTATQPSNNSSDFEDFDFNGEGILGASGDNTPVL